MHSFCVLCYSSLLPTWGYWGQIRHELPSPRKSLPDIYLEWAASPLTIPQAKMDSTFSSFLSVSRLFGPWYITIPSNLNLTLYFGWEKHVSRGRIQGRDTCKFFDNVLGSAWSLQASQGCIREVTGNLLLEAFPGISPALFRHHRVWISCTSWFFTHRFAPPAFSLLHFVGKVTKNLNSVYFAQMQEVSVDSV